jgi:hypothetical protein
LDALLEDARSALLRVELRATIEAPWTALDPIDVGEVSSGRGTPSVYVTVQEDGEPVFRIDVHEHEPACYAFEAAIAWAGFVVIGFGSRVHFVSTRTRHATTIPLSGYFGYVYPQGDRLLVADASYLRCFDSDGALLWRSKELGIDGVVVSAVADGIIEGQGEWDPPGGWVPFRVDLVTGARVDV